MVKTLELLRHRAHRDLTGRFVVEGERFVARALDGGWPIERLVVSERARERTLLRVARERGVPITRLPASEFDSVLHTPGVKIAAILRQRWSSLPEKKGRLWVAIESNRSPGNLGALLRTMEAAGAHGIILLSEDCDPFDPVALRGSMGSLFAQALVRTRYPCFARWVRRRRVTVIGTAVDGSRDYRAQSYRGPVVLMAGHERHGLSPQQEAYCDRFVHIPMHGALDSLNLVVATSLVLYEARNQRHPSRQRR
ncbi:MAG: RNA methyltransferase [Myxococcota bacterium]